MPQQQKHFFQVGMKKQITRGKLYIHDMLHEFIKSSGIKNVKKQLYGIILKFGTRINQPSEAVKQIR